LNPQYIVAFVTSKDLAEAKKISKTLLDEKLVACVNVVKGVSSFFWWEGKLDKADEALLIIKSRRSCLQKIIKCVKKTHSYTNPEIIALPIIGGNKDYLKWINESVQK